MTVAGTPLVAVVFALLVGLVVGSFANVCIHRLPRGESVVAPRSRCPSCRTRIEFYDNVPVLSWLLLRGRCRTCRAPISVRYPLVELSVGLVFAASVAAFGPTWEAAAGAALGAACLVLAAMDLESRVLPDEVTLGTLGLGLGLALLSDVAADGPAFGNGFVRSHVAAAVSGALFGAGVLFAVRVVYQRLRGVEGMGDGDVAMIAMTGAFVGPAGVFLTLFLSSLSGAVIGGLLWVLRRIAWRWAESRGRQGPEAASIVSLRHGVLFDGDGAVREASPVWKEIPGVTAPGTAAEGSGTEGRRPSSILRLLAFVRLAGRRARRGLATETPRLFVEDEASGYFRVFALRGVPVPGGVLVLLSRADVPFGVFLAAGSVLTYAAGRPLLAALAGQPDLPLPWLLP